MQAVVLVLRLGGGVALVLQQGLNAGRLYKQAVLQLGGGLKGEVPIHLPVGIVRAVVGVHIDPVDAQALGMAQGLVRPARVQQGRVIVLDDLIEHGPDGTDGADLLHFGNVRIQCQVPDDGAVDPHFHQDIRTQGAVVGQRVMNVADGDGHNPARIGRVQGLTVQGVRVNRRGLRGWLGSRCLGGGRHGGLRGGYLRGHGCPGRHQGAAAEQAGHCQK